MDAGALIGYMLLALTGIITAPEAAVFILTGCVIYLARHMVTVVKRLAA